MFWWNFFNCAKFCGSSFFSRFLISIICCVIDTLIKTFSTIARKTSNQKKMKKFFHRMKDNRIRDCEKKILKIMKTIFHQIQWLWNYRVFEFHIHNACQQICQMFHQLNFIFQYYNHISWRKWSCNAEKTFENIHFLISKQWLIIWTWCYLMNIKIIYWILIKRECVISWISTNRFFIKSKLGWPRRVG